MCERLVEQVANVELNGRVIAMLSLNKGERLGAISQRREVPPGLKQLGLDAKRSDATDDQPLTVRCRGLGDLRFPGLGVVHQRNPRCFGDQGDRRSDRRGLPHPNRVQHAVRGEPCAELGVVKAGVGAQQNLAGRASARYPREQLVNEANDAALRVGLARRSSSKTTSIASSESFTMWVTS